jgi:glyoxylase-like metal-dependent hydrolase (beta-lactamase superfamily II)
MLSIELITGGEGIASNCYLLRSADALAVVDPSVSYYDAVKKAYIPQGALKYIFVTHAHFDHILEIDSWVKETGATVIVSKYDKSAMSDPHLNCYSFFLSSDGGYFGEVSTVDEGDTIALGEDVIEVLSFPGHTPGCVAYKCGNDLLVGDTLFAFGFGRYDLPGGDFESLKASLKRLLSMPPETVIYPGHGETSDIGRVRKNFSK